MLPLVFQHAYIVSIVPNRGPQSGGTEITVSGGYMGNSTDTQVTIGDMDCPLVEGKR